MSLYGRDTGNVFFRGFDDSVQHFSLLFRGLECLTSHRSCFGRRRLNTVEKIFLLRGIELIGINEMLDMC